MPKQSFALEANGPQRLIVSWRPLFQKAFISIDGNTIGVIHDRNDLSTGKEFLLPDGSTLRVQLVRLFMENELQVLRNGQPMPGSASDPQTRLKRTSQNIFWTAGVCLTISLYFALFEFETFWRSTGFPAVLFGLVLTLLGFFVKRKSVIALVFAVLIWVVFSVLILYLSLQYHYSIIGLLVFVYSVLSFLLPMLQGFGAIQALQDERE